MSRADPNELTRGPARLIDHTLKGGSVCKRLAVPLSTVVSPWPSWEQWDEPTDEERRLFEDGDPPEDCPPEHCPECGQELEGKSDHVHFYP